MRDDAKDAERYRHIRNIFSNFVLHYYGALDRPRWVRTHELDKLIDDEIAEGMHKNAEGDPELPAWRDE